jgi:uncharacterized repeat protein (TIGR03803 family)
MGNLYGTTPFGGRFNNGTVFKIAPTGKETILHNFKGGAEGSTPVGRLLRDTSGDLYGATSTGGNSTNSGVLFRLDKFGKETVLYTFTCPQCSGKKGVGFGNPTGGLVRDSAGTFYGVALGGNQHNSGVVYQVDKAGKGTVLHKFSGGTDGWNPGGNLIWDAAGNLYGDTWAPDGSACWVGECGNVFRVNRRGQKTVLYRFQGGADGGHPTGGLVRDSQGNLFGTTWIGGTKSGSCDIYGRGCGVVFKLDPAGAETVLYTFMLGTDGGYPNADLVRDAAGNLYGTTVSGGDPTCQCGVVFKITP